MGILILSFLLKRYWYFSERLRGVEALLPYKPHLLFSLSEIALEKQTLVEREANQVWIPLRLLAETYLISHWNLLSYPHFIPITSSEREGKPSELRRTFAKIQKKLPTLEAYLEKQAVLYYGRLMDLDLQKDVNTYKAQWEQFLLRLKLKLQGEQGKNAFEFQPKRKLVSVPNKVWLEVSGSPFQIRQIAIHRWAKDIERDTKGLIREKESIELLERKPDFEFMLQKVRNLLLQQDGLRCLWSGLPLREETLALDQFLPYPNGRGQFLWNLFPRDRNPSESNMDSVSQHSRIQHTERETKEIWNFLSKELPNRFHFDLEHFLGTQYDPKTWEDVLFTRISETTEQTLNE